MKTNRDGKQLIDMTGNTGKAMCHMIEAEKQDHFNEYDIDNVKRIFDICTRIITKSNKGYEYD